jgi:single-stranded DNA-binding protein
MINKVILLGVLVKKTFRETKKGISLCQLQIITHKRFTDSQGTKKKIAAWHTVDCFAALAETTNKNAEIGDIIFVDGENCSREIEEGGRKIVINSVSANEIKIMTLKRQKGIEHGY